MWTEAVAKILHFNYNRCHYTPDVFQLMTCRIMFVWRGTTLFFDSIPKSLFKIGKSDLNTLYPLFGLLWS